MFVKARCSRAAIAAVALTLLIAQPLTADMYIGGNGAAPSAPLAGPGSQAGSGLTFNFTKGPGILALESGTPAEQQLAADVVAGFEAGGALWSAQFTDAITINVTIDFTTLSPGILGSTLNETEQLDFSPAKTALINDAKTAADAVATANFQPGTGLDMVTNDTSVVPSPRFRDNDGSGNNFALDVPRGNMKAIGQLPAADPAEDGGITFSDYYSWDFDRSDGISVGSFDFVGVAAHEIGHLMGYVSGVDIVDLTGGDGPYAPIDLDIYRVFSILDLCRYSADSLSEPNQPANGALLDLAYGDSPYFSIDAGATSEGLFSTGVYNGDGRQASHWKDNLGLGIMDPTVAPGELMSITALDILAFDVIGYDSVPEPGTLVLLAVGAAGIIARRRRGIS